MFSWVWVILCSTCLISLLVSRDPLQVLVQTLVLDWGEPQPPTSLIDSRVVIFHPLLYLWEDFHFLHPVLTPVFILAGVVVDTWMLGIHLTFLMSHHPPHCFFLMQLSWSILPISYILDFLLIVSSYFGEIILSCKVHIFPLSPRSWSIRVYDRYNFELAYRIG